MQVIDQFDKFHSLFIGEISNLLHWQLDGLLINMFHVWICCANSFNFVFKTSFHLVKDASNFMVKLVKFCINL